MSGQEWPVAHGNPISGQGMFFFNHRDRQPELMDQPGLDPHSHQQALAGLRRVNLLSGTASTLFSDLRKLTPSDGDRLRVLDIATGGGDVAIEIQSLANRSKFPLRMSGCDISETAVNVASSRAQAAGLEDIEFFRHDALHDTLPRSYDVVMCSLFLHHLDESDTISLLRKMSAACTQMVLVDDLLRTAWGYILAWAGCRLLTQSGIVHVDGPLSVRGAFSEHEFHRLALQAGLEGAEFRRHWPQRLTLRWMKRQAFRE